MLFCCKILSKLHAILWGEFPQNLPCFFSAKVAQKLRPLYRNISQKNCIKKKNLKICILRKLSQKFTFLKNFHKDLHFLKISKNKFTFLVNFHNYFALLGEFSKTFFSQKKICPFKKSTPKLICKNIFKTKLAFLVNFHNQFALMEDFPQTFF